MPTAINWMIGLSLMFSLAMLMTVLSEQTPESFVSWLTIFAGYTVWAGLIDLWILILIIIVLVVMIFSDIRKRGSI